MAPLPSPKAGSWPQLAPNKRSLTWDGILTLSKRPALRTVFTFRAIITLCLVLSLCARFVKNKTQVLLDCTDSTLPPGRSRPRSGKSLTPCHVLRACQEKLSQSKDHSAGRELRSSTLGAAEDDVAKVWQIPKLKPSRFHADLGWAETRGAGLTQGRVNVRSCFVIQVKSKDGGNFDQGCLQRAAFIANLTSDPDRKTLRINIHPGLIRLAADVTYLPESSSHRVCYVAPNPGVYRVQVRLMFTNAFLVQTKRDRKNLGGFAEYVPVIQSSAIVTADSSFSLLRHRNKLPPCSLGLLSDSRNQGFWLAHTWLPLACRLRRVSPSSLLRWLHGKNILFLGDSEMRYAYGCLQFYASLPTRGHFWMHWLIKPKSRASVLESVAIPGGLGVEHPLKANGSDIALHTKYEVATGESVFVGSRYSGFGLQHLQLEVPPKKTRRDNGRSEHGDVGNSTLIADVSLSSGKRRLLVDANLTYISFFDTHGKVVQPWMLNRTVTGGETPYDSGRPFDVVIEGSILHAVLKHESAVDYGAMVSSRFAPQMRELCPRETCKFASFGPLAGVDEKKPDWFLHKSNNVRNFVFEEALHATMMGEGFPNMLHMSSVTVPVRGSELTFDIAHYRAPVQLAMIDLVFGSLCSEKPCEGRFV